MNQIVLALGLQSWKPVITSLLLPPVPWLLLLLLGAGMLRRRRGWGRVLITAGAVATWLSCTGFGAWWTQRLLLDPPYALGPQEIAGLKPAPGGPATAIVVLGGGMDPYAPEYDMANLSPLAVERLRYGVWLSRRTGLPLAFTGGLAPTAEPGSTEAALAQRIAAEEFRHPLRWAEDRSSDTHENATFTLRLLREQGIARLVIVTHQPHIPRSMRNFERARQATGATMSFVPAPIGVGPHRPAWRIYDFFPSTGSIADMRYAVREWLGLIAGA